MIKRQRGSITAEELHKELMANPEYVEMRRKKDKELEERVKKIRAEQEPIISDLQRIGISINRVSDFINRPNDYDEAIPILFEHLLKPYSEITQESLARALAVPKASYLWPQLAQIFKKQQVDLNYQPSIIVKDGLAVALSATVTEKTLNELIELVKDKKQGPSRLLLLRSLKKRARRPEIADLLISLKDDQDLKEEIKAWMKGREKRQQKKKPA